MEAKPVTAVNEAPPDFIVLNLEAIEACYGTPAVEILSYDLEDEDFELVLRSKRKNRTHDVTVYIIEGDRVAVIAKHSYPPGVYRAPSGGLEPGESLEAGAAREAYEETGLTIALQDYVYRCHVRFSCLGISVDWISHVFTAKRLVGEIQPFDLREISEARWVTFEDLNGPIQTAMETSGKRGLRYRADLHRKVVSELHRRGLIP
ncbi:MAG: NUDIX hydrolase [Armatimonadetes bacterium]|nr:NUDIX hydrolase [Armatimonadota bacterium]